jgi:EmrB/QacA subfamily drug resistance transporter
LTNNKKTEDPLLPFLSRFATHENRWYALIIIALGLAIVIIDNTILNVSIPYILRDLHSEFSEIQWSISGYALTIATILITAGRVGDLIGRKKMFLIGIVIFAVGSFIASISTDATTLIFGRAVIQAVGAAIMLTSALALLASEFHKRERAIAFGIWGAVAGASATVGPLLGGYLTTYFSWRWSLRINVIVAIIAIIGSLFIIESKGEQEKHFDWWGTILSAAGFFSLVFAFIEGTTYGWLTPNKPFSLLGLSWPLSTISVIPFFFIAAILFLTLFALHEHRFEKKGRSPILSISLFAKRGFIVGAMMLSLLAFSLLSVFFNLPIYIENVLGYNAFSTGIVFLSATIPIFIMASITGFLVQKIKIKWIIVTGMILLVLGVFFLIPSITLNATDRSLMPSLILFGIGFGLCSAQLNNIIISSAPLKVAGEAAATSITMRQIGSAIGIAVIGSILASTLITNITLNIQGDTNIPDAEKPAIIEDLKKIDIESGQITLPSHTTSALEKTIKTDIDKALVESTRTAMQTVLYFLIGLVIISLFLPSEIKEELPNERREKQKKEITLIEDRSTFGRK